MVAVVMFFKLEPFFFLLFPIQLITISHIKSCSFPLYYIQPFIFMETIQVMNQSLVNSRLDYCNLLAGLLFVYDPEYHYMPCFHSPQRFNEWFSVRWALRPLAVHTRTPSVLFRTQRSDVEHRIMDIIVNKTNCSDVEKPSGKMRT